MINFWLATRQVISDSGSLSRKVIVAEDRVQPVIVVEAHEVVGNAGGGPDGIGVAVQPDAFRFQVQEESLHHRIVPAGALMAHADREIVLGQQLAADLGWRTFVG